MTDKRDSSESTASAAAGSSEDAEEPIRVLIVDDDAEYAALTATYLERTDDRFDVDFETDAIAGLAALDGTPYECVVSDFDMPDLDGVEFLSSVRDRDPELPFILYTGMGSEEVAIEAISAEVTDYVRKYSGIGQYDVLANRVLNAVTQYRTFQKLEWSRERLSLFYEQSPLGIIEWDEGFRITMLNQSAEEILGYAEQELVGKSWETIVPESDLDQVAAVVSALFEDDRENVSINANVRKDGERILCEWHNRVVTDGDGDVVTIFSQFQDITERRRQERRLETLIANLPGIVYRGRNEPGRPMENVWGEVEELTEYSPTDAWEDGLYGNEIIHPDDRSYVRAEVQAALVAGESFELTYRIVTKSGSIKWVWERGRSIEVENEDRSVLEGFITDVTDQAKAPPSDSHEER